MIKNTGTKHPINKFPSKTKNCTKIIQKLFFFWWDILYKKKTFQNSNPSRPLFYRGGWLEIKRNTGHKSKLKKMKIKKVKVKGDWKTKNQEKRRKLFLRNKKNMLYLLTDNKLKQPMRQQKVQNWILKNKIVYKMMKKP